MKRNRSFALCCGAGGAQMFKEAEKGKRKFLWKEQKMPLKTGAGIIATACPFCMTHDDGRIKVQKQGRGD